MPDPGGSSAGFRLIKVIRPSTFESSRVVPSGLPASVSMTSTPYWIIATVETLPEVITEGVVLREGFPEDSEEAPESGELQYSLLCRTIAGGEVEARSLVESALQNMEVHRIVDLSILSTDVTTMVRSERRIIRATKPGGVSVHTSFMAFKREHELAREQAHSIIGLGMLRKRWQFWR